MLIDLEDGWVVAKVQALTRNTSERKGLVEPGDPSIGKTNRRTANEPGAEMPASGSTATERARWCEQHVRPRFLTSQEREKS